MNNGTKSLLKQFKAFEVIGFILLNQYRKQVEKLTRQKTNKCIRTLLWTAGNKRFNLLSKRR